MLINYSVSGRDFSVSIHVNAFLVESNSIQEINPISFCSCLHILLVYGIPSLSE